MSSKFELEWLAMIRNLAPNYPPIREQSVRLRLANGAWYKPDLFATLWPQTEGPAMPTAWECKGTKAKGKAKGLLTIKVAATQYPDICFVLVWKDETGRWAQQRILP